MILWVLVLIVKSCREDLEERKSDIASFGMSFGLNLFSFFFSLFSSFFDILLLL